uniref:BED-type domain-containing protein n=1 Tax=Meloidogyne incognita TaxID=6306 RepID=A0A914NC29_MELIC
MVYSLIRLADSWKSSDIRIRYLNRKFRISCLFSDPNPSTLFCRLVKRLSKISRFYKLKNSLNFVFNPHYQKIWIIYYTDTEIRIRFKTSKTFLSQNENIEKTQQSEQQIENVKTTQRPIQRRPRVGGSSAKTAEVWRFFSERPNGEKAATCSICQKTIKATNSRQANNFLKENKRVAMTINCLILGIFSSFLENRVKIWVW